MNSYGNKGGNFTSIDNEILDHPGLRARDKLVLCLLIRWSYRKDTFEVSGRKIATAIGCVRDTVRDALESLEVLAIIERRGTRGKREKLILHLDQVANLPKESSSSKRGNLPKDSSGTRRTFRPLVDERLGHIKNKRIINNKNDEVLDPRGKNGNHATILPIADLTANAFKAEKRTNGLPKAQTWQKAIIDEAVPFKEQRLWELCYNGHLLTVGKAIALCCGGKDATVETLSTLGQKIAETIGQRVAQKSSWDELPFGRFFTICVTVFRQHGSLDEDAVDDEVTNSLVPF
jgi:hypothetical protein